MKDSLYLKDKGYLCHMDVIWVWRSLKETRETTHIHQIQQKFEYVKWPIVGYEILFISQSPVQMIIVNYTALVNL